MLKSSLFVAFPPPPENPESLGGGGEWPKIQQRCQQVDTKLGAPSHERTGTTEPRTIHGLSPEAKQACWFIPGLYYLYWWVKTIHFADSKGTFFFFAYPVSRGWEGHAGEESTGRCGVTAETRTHAVNAVSAVKPLCTTALRYTRMYFTLIPSHLCPKREWGPEGEFKPAGEE